MPSSVIQYTYITKSQHEHIQYDHNIRSIYSPARKQSADEQCPLHYGCSKHPYSALEKEILLSLVD